MIKIKSLFLENFMCVKKAEFDFDHNVIIISGKSASGKSAVFDAIALCISSKKRSTSYSEYVRQGCSHAKVILDCIINNKPVHFNLQLNLLRGTPYQMALTYENEVYRNTEADVVLKSFDIEYYSDIIFSMQSDDYRDITQLSPTQRSNYLQRLLNFDFQRQKEKIIKDLETYRNQTSKLNSDILVKEQFIAKEKEGNEELIELKLKEQDIQKIQTEISNKQEKINSYQQNQQQVIDFNNRSAQISKELVELNSEKNKIENKINIINEHKKLFEESEKQLARIIAELSTNKDLKEKSELDIENFNNELESARSKYHEIKNRIEYAKSELLNYERLSSLELQGKCPMCERETTEFLREKLETFKNSQYDGTDAKGHTMFDVLMIEKKKGHSFTHIKDSINNWVNDEEKLTFNHDIQMKFCKENINRSQRDLLISESKIKQLEEEQVKINNQIETLDNNFEETFDLSNNLKLLNIKIKDNNSLLLDLEKELNKVRKNEDISLLSQEILNLTNVINNHFNNIKTNNEIIVRNKQRETNIEKYKKEITNINVEIKDIAIQQNIYEDAFNILDKSLPNYMVVKTCNSLQTEMNSFIQSIFPKYEVQLINSKKGCEFFYTKDNTILEQVKKRNNAWINSKMSSGFEKALLTMAFKVSLAQLYGINILIGDEVDGAADDESSESLFELLITNSTFDQIFIISHKRKIKELITDNTNDNICYEALLGDFEIV